MTRKHFQLIADAVATATTTAKCDNARKVHEQIARELARALSTTNDRFDTMRFLAACGVD